MATVGTKAKSADTIEIAAIWYAVWVSVEPESAIPAVADHLASISIVEEQTHFAMIFATRLSANLCHPIQGAQFPLP